MINFVNLRKQDNCFTYALKRCGIATEVYLKMDSGNFINLKGLETIPEEHLNVGDLLVYVFDITDDSRRDTTTQITVDREIITGEFHYNKHFMVYEGDGIISEVVRSEGLPEINLRYLRDLKDDYLRVVI